MPSRYENAYDGQQQQGMSLSGLAMDTAGGITVPSTPLYDVKPLLDASQQLQRHGHSLQYQVAGVGGVQDLCNQQNRGQANAMMPTAATHAPQSWGGAQAASHPQQPQAIGDPNAGQYWGSNSSVYY